MTISSAAVLASPTSLVVISMVVPAEGLNRLTQISTQAEAIRPVKMKVPMVPPRMRPSRFMLAMLPTAEAMDTKTRGTTMVNSRLRKMSPMGLMVVPTAGATAPMTAPTTMPPKIRIRLPYCCQKVFCLMMLDEVDMVFSPLLSSYPCGRMGRGVTARPPQPAAEPSPFPGWRGGRPRSAAYSPTGCGRRYSPRSDRALPCG